MHRKACVISSNKSPNKIFDGELQTSISMKRKKTTCEICDCGEVLTTVFSAVHERGEIKMLIFP